MKKGLFIIGLLCLILNSCSKYNDEDTKWWILVHPSQGNEGIYLYNETQSTVELRLDIPDKLTSPHALDYDGRSLWIGGMSDSASIFELSPVDGSILSEIKNIRTAGIKCSDGELYYSTDSEIHKIKPDGTPIDTFFIETNVIQDIAIDNSTLYFVVNSKTDPIIKFDQVTSKTDTILDTHFVVLYTLSIVDNTFIAVNGSNAICRFDIASGNKISYTKTTLKGWITAIAPYNK